MNALHLIRLRIEPAALMRFAHGQDVLDRHDEGHGYAMHAWLAAMFGTFAPQPFRYFEERGELLGHSASDANALLEHAQAFAPPEAFGALQAGSLAGKPMPAAWREGQRLAFEVQTTPIVRTTQGVEKDALLHTLDRLGDAAPPRGSDALNQLREDTYRTWLRRQWGEALELDELNITALARLRLMRRKHDDARTRHTLERPIVTFAGQGRIRDPEAFARLLARGIGRHRAFGLGMILLAPPR
ncbi:MAG: type I-E CRISPR-associated protein Cas6/Cse3/CasE [Halothiobacillaceae bacterium]|nr:MAG: type I-E CRISPR-associated protein Cas6/Cse3/CasE [Halothiobacillaceae bacterium]